MIVFLWLLGMNFVLTLMPLNLGAQIFLMVLGFSVSLVMVPAWKPPAGGEQQKESAFLTAIPSWAWILLAGGALAVRFYQLTGLSLWPLDDEAMSSHYALELARFGHWQWTYDFSGLPPLYIWYPGRDLQAL